MTVREPAAAPMCSAMVSEPPHYFHRHPCTRIGKVEAGGKLYCNQHAKQAKRLEAIRRGE